MGVVSVALAGGIASGKSTVAQLFEERGAVIVDADLLAREVVAPGTPGLAEVVSRFGNGILDANGHLDRALLAAIVFDDAAARADLNAIIHPRVRALGEERIAEVREGVVISVIPLLVETRGQERFSGVIVVDLPEAEQLRRLMARNGLTRVQAQARLAAQATRSERLAVATWVIDNSGTVLNLPRQVNRVWAELVRRAGG